MNMLASAQQAPLRRRKRLRRLCFVLLVLMLATSLLSLLGTAVITWSHHPGETLRNFHGDTPTWGISVHRGVLSFLTYTPIVPSNKPWSITLDTRYDPGFRWDIPDTAGPCWSRLGIGAAATSTGSYTLRWYSVSLIWPLLAIGVITLLVYRRAHIPPPGHCLVCGYDLRASPERCPECGSPVPSDHAPEIGS
jgi:hypothetical protein